MVPSLDSSFDDNSTISLVHSPVDHGFLCVDDVSSDSSSSSAVAVAFVTSALRCLEAGLRVDFGLGV